MYRTAGGRVGWWCTQGYTGRHIYPGGVHLPTTRVVYTGVSLPYPGGIYRVSLPYPGRCTRHVSHTRVGVPDMSPIPGCTYGCISHTHGVRTGVPPIPTVYIRVPLTTAVYPGTSHHRCIPGFIFHPERYTRGLSSHPERYTRECTTDRCVPRGVLPPVVYLGVCTERNSP